MEKREGKWEEGKEGVESGCEGGGGETGCGGGGACLVPYFVWIVWVGVGFEFGN